MAITIKDDEKQCVKCLKVKKKSTGFFNSYDDWHTDGKMVYCKQCLKDVFDEDNIATIKEILRRVDKPFNHELYINAKDSDKETLGRYMTLINFNNKYDTYEDSVFENNSTKNSDDNNEYEIIDKDESNQFDDQDKKDIIRMIGYDPFEYESEEDKPHLYSDLVNFLDESTVEDGFKLQAVIEIVTGFNQIDKVNRAITSITSNPSQMSANSSGIKSLVGTKKDILASLVKLAEENGISVKHNRQKSKGAGTLSGIIKQLQEKGIEQADVNLFDIETSRGMSQVADISNQSILKQLQFDENDYNQMLIEQRDLIQELDDKAMKLEEENRLLKKEMLTYNQVSSQDD